MYRQVYSPGAGYIGACISACTLCHSARARTAYSYDHVKRIDIPRVRKSVHSSSQCQSCTIMIIHVNHILSTIHIGTFLPRSSAASLQIAPQTLKQMRTNFLINIIRSTDPYHQAYPSCHFRVWKYLKNTLSSCSAEMTHGAGRHGDGHLRNMFR